MKREGRSPPVGASGTSENTRTTIQEPHQNSPLPRQFQPSEPPADFDPRRFPIISRHFYGLRVPIVERSPGMRAA